MSSQITLQTKDGRIIQGINYAVSTSALPTDPNVLGSQMQGQMAYGVYHVHTATGWQYIPANQIAAVLQTSLGAPT